MTLVRRLPRFVLSLGGVAAITWVGYAVIPVNPTTQGFAYLLFVLAVATAWGLWEAVLGSVAATLFFNLYFFEPKLTLTIADPDNWVALFSFLATSLVASQLSTKARQRTLDALERQRDLERLYTFGRLILLADEGEAFARQLARKLAETFHLDAVALFEIRTGEIHRAGPSDFEGIDSQIREAGWNGQVFTDADHRRVITGVRLGAAPVAGLALQGELMPDSVLQSIVNLVAIGLERAKAQEFARQVEVEKRSDQLRTTLIDAIAHEFKTPLTSIRAASSLLSSGVDLNSPGAVRMWKIADEEAAHLEELIDNAIDVSRLDTEQIDLHLEVSDLEMLVRQVVDSMQAEAGDRRLTIESLTPVPPVAIDRRLTRLAVTQLVANALKYSPQSSPVVLQLSSETGIAKLDITDHGGGIPQNEQERIFQRFYRSPSVKANIPGKGLGLSIAYRVIAMHKGHLSVESRPGETTFHIELPIAKREVKS